LNAMLNTESEIINITALVSVTDLNHGMIDKCVKIMTRLGFVEDIKLGRTRLIKLNRDDEAVKLMLSLLELLSARVATLNK